MSRIKLLFYVFIIMILSLFCVGCGAFFGKSEPATIKSVPNKTDSSREFEMSEFVLKAVEAMYEVKGYKYEYHSSSNFHMERKDQSFIRVTSKYDSTVNYHNDPTPYLISFHEAGTSTVYNQKTKIESYLVEGMFCKKWGQDQWSCKDSESYDSVPPTDSLAYLNSLIAYVSDDKEIKGIQLKKEQNAYLLTVDYLMLRDPSYKTDLIDISLKDIKEQTKALQLSIKPDLNKIEVMQYEHRYWFDLNTFQIMKEQERKKVKVPTTEGDIIYYDMPIDVVMTGEFKEEISLPEEVKQLVEKAHQQEFSE